MANCIAKGTHLRNAAVAADVAEPVKSAGQCRTAVFIDADKQCAERITIHYY